jgi:hypothetical protein
MKMAVFWAVVLCSLVEVACCLIALMMEAASTSEMLVNFFLTTCNDTADCHLAAMRTSNLTQLKISLAWK